MTNLKNKYQISNTLTNNFQPGKLYTDETKDAILRFVKRDNESVFFKLVEGRECYLNEKNGLIPFYPFQTFHPVELIESNVEPNIVCIKGSYTLRNLLKEFRFKTIRKCGQDVFTNKTNTFSLECASEEMYYELHLDSKTIEAFYYENEFKLLNQQDIDITNLRKLLIKMKKPNRKIAYQINGCNNLPGVLKTLGIDLNNFLGIRQDWIYIIINNKIEYGKLKDDSNGSFCGDGGSAWEDKNEFQIIECTIHNIANKMNKSNMRKIIGYKSTEECYGFNVGTLFVKLKEGYNWYVPYTKCETQSIPASLVEKYFTPAYEEDEIKLPEINGYKGELTKTGVKYGCQEKSFNQIKELVDAVINKFKITGKINIGDYHMVEVDQIKQVYNELVRVNKIKK